MGGNCSNLQQYDDACKISSCVASVKGLASNSSSPTDTWILKFKSGTNYDEIPVKTGFLKFWIDPDSIPRNVIDNGTVSKDYMKLLNGLNYEVKVYRNIIRPLIDYNICPNFVKYLGSSQRCSFLNLQDICKGKASALKNLPRNISYMFYNQSNRPAIEDSTAVPIPQQYELQPAFLGSLTYNFLINQMIPDGTIKFADWQAQYINSNAKFTPDYWRVVFQVMAACYAMSLTKMTHNDLHIGNIWVIPFSHNKEPVAYIYNNKNYNFVPKVKVMIYDFDRAYVHSFRDNQTLAGPTCAQGSQCNEFIPNKDVIKFFGYVYNSTQNIENRVTIIEDILTKNKQQADYLKDVYNNNLFLISSSGNRISSREFNAFNSPDKILDRVGKLANMSDIIPLSDINIGNVFICNPNLFTKNGQIKYPLVSQVEANKLKIVQLEAEIARLKGYYGI